MKQVTSGSDLPPEAPNPLELLFSSDSEGGDDVRLVRIMDGGSKSQMAWKEFQSLTQDDITIMGQGLFARVAAAAHLRKDFHKADKIPSTYDRKTFHLHGCMDIWISPLQTRL